MGRVPGGDPWYGGVTPAVRRDRVERDPARILVLSDTHVPYRAPDLPLPVWQAAEQADLILHAGDVVEAWVLAALRRLAPVLAVHGNVDGAELLAALPAARVVEVAGVRIGLTHGHRGRGRTTAERARAAFAAGGVDAVVFGHSHEPCLERGPDGALLVNPGSPTDPRRAPRPSFAWLRVEAGRVEAEHVYL